MAIRKQADIGAARRAGVGRAMAAAVASVGAAFSGGLARLAGERAAVVGYERPLSGEANQASALFRRGVEENSNLEADWLWLASQLGTPWERRYCYCRALAINPHSETARRALAIRG